MRISDWSSDVCSSDLSEFLDAQRLRLRVAFVTLRIRVLVEPDLGGRIQCVAFSVLMAFFEEQKVRLDSGIRIEDAVRQADDGVQVALRHQLLLDARLDAFAKECAIRQDDSGAARSEEHTSELQSLMRISYAVFCLKKKKIISEAEHDGKIAISH